MKQSGVLLAIPLFALVTVAAADFVCYLQWNGTLLQHKFSSLNQSSLSFPLRNGTGPAVVEGDSVRDHQNQTINIHLPDNETFVNDFIHGLYFGKIVFENSSNKISLNISTPLACDTLLSIPLSFCDYRNDSILPHNFLNETMNLPQPKGNDTTTPEDSDSNLFPELRNCSDRLENSQSHSFPSMTYFACACDHIPLRNQTSPSPLPSEPHPPLRVRYIPETHKLNIEPSSPLLIPPQWLEGDILPFVNCSVIFASQSLVRMSDGNSNFPNCSWSEKNSSSILTVILPRHSLLRQHDQIVFNFLVSGPDTVVNSIYTYHPEVESVTKYSTKNLLSFWGLYRERRLRYIETIKDYHGNRNSPQPNWTIIVSSSTRRPTSSPSYSPTLTPSLVPTNSPSFSPTLIPSLIPTNSPSFLDPTGTPISLSTFLPTTGSTGSPVPIQSLPPLPSFPTSTTNISSSTGSPKSSPSCSPTFTPSLIQTNSPSLRDPIRTISLPRIVMASPVKTPSKIPTQTLSQPLSLLPTSVPSILQTTKPSSLPSLIPPLDCLVQYKTPILPLEVTDKLIHLRVRFPSIIYSPCLTTDCLQPQVCPPSDQLELDASTSYTDSIFPLNFIWSVVNVSRSPFCSQSQPENTDLDCLKYTPKILTFAMNLLHRFVFNSSSPVLRIPNTLLLAGVQYTFQLRVQLVNTWDGKMSHPSKNYTFHILTSHHPLPTLTISGSQPLTRAPFFADTQPHEPLILSSSNKFFLIDKEIIWNAASATISPKLFLPSNFSSGVGIFGYQWEIFELSRNSSLGWFPVSAFTSHDKYFSIPNTFAKVASMKNNISIPYLLHLTVVTGERNLSPSTSSLLLFENTPQPNAIIVGGSRCIFPDVNLLLESRDTGSSSNTVLRWSCWVMDTHYRDSYNIGKESKFNSYTQCSSGDEFSGVRHEITNSDRKITAINQLSSGCSGYIVNSQDSTLNLEAGALQIGVKYKFCVEIFSSKSQLSIDCIGVYVYIPVNSEVNHFTRMNDTSTSTLQRNLESRKYSWQPFKLLTPFLSPSRHPSLTTTKYSLNAEHPLKLTIQTPSPSQPNIMSRLTCESSAYPFTTWRFRSQVPGIYRLHPTLMELHELRNTQNYVSFPLSTSPSVFGYSSFKYVQNSFPAGNSFTFSVSSSCSSESKTKNDNAFLYRGYSEITIAIPQTPRSGQFQVFPDSGISFETKGYLSQSDWIVQESGDLPLQYSFYYTTYSSESTPNFDDAEEIVCLRDWSFDPSHNFTFPMVNHFPLIDETMPTVVEFWNSTLYHSEMKVLIHGVVRDSKGAFSLASNLIDVNTPWDTSFNAITSLVSVIDEDNIFEVKELKEKLLHHATAIHLEVKKILYKDCFDLCLQQNHLTTYNYLYGLSIALNSFPIYYLDQNQEISRERYELRSLILEFLFNSSQWTWQSNLKSSYTHLSYHLISTIIKATALPDEIQESSKILLVELIQHVISRSVEGASHSFLGSGYFSPKYCSQFETLKTADTIEDLLTTLDRIAPIVNFAQSNEVIKTNEFMYKQILLGLKMLLVGCALPGERVGSSGESNYLPENAISGISQPTLLDGDATDDMSGNVTQINGNETMTPGNTTFQPSFSPTESGQPQTVKKYGSQIGVLRQSIYGKFSQASVTVGTEVIIDHTNFTDNIGNQSNISFSVASLASSYRVDREPFSFLQLPCDTTHLNSCKMSPTQLSLSRALGNEISIEDALSLISKQDSVIDLSILNVPILEPGSYELGGVDRTWVPLQSNSGVSDAVIVEFKTSATINQSFFNLSSTIEVGVRVSRPDVLWKLAVVNPDNNITKIGDRHFLRQLRQNEPPPESQDLIFSPRWVRCELFDSTNLSWVKPDWLDGWWSPDVASFATEGELKSAAQKYGTLSVDTPSKTSKISSYLAINSSVSKLPTSLSCFLNSIMISSENNGTLMDHSIWLQWRTVSQTQDPCGGCSGHGICVLFRTAPLCLCQENYRGRFCDKFIPVNSTRDGSSSKEWHLTTPLAPSGLTAFAYLIFFLLSFVTLFQLIKRFVYSLLVKEDYFRPLYSLLGTNEVESMTTSQFLESSDGSLMNRRDLNNFDPTEERCYSLGETSFSDLSLTSSVTISMSCDDSVAVAPSSNRSWISNILLRWQQYFQFRRNGNIDHHRDEDTFADQSMGNGLFVSSHTYGNGIEILDQRFPDSLIDSHSHENENHNQNLSPHQLTVRGINMFVEESKSMRHYDRMQRKSTNILSSEIDHEKSLSLRQRKSS